MDVKKLTSLFKNTKFVLTKINYVPPMFKRTPCLIADSIVWAPEYIEGREGQIFKYQKTNSKDIKFTCSNLKQLSQVCFPFIPILNIHNGGAYLPNLYV